MTIIMTMTVIMTMTIIMTITIIIRLLFPLQTAVNSEQIYNNVEIQHEDSGRPFTTT